MKKSNKKGFTIVELVIVIAVIAILAAVLIPTFSNVVEKANESKDMQQARNAYEEWLATQIGGETFNMEEVNLCIKSGDHFYHVVNGQFIAKGSKSDTNGCVSTKMNVESSGELKEITAGVGA